MVEEETATGAGAGLDAGAAAAAAPAGAIDVRGSLALVGTVVFWGLMPVFLRALTEHVSAWEANGLRYPLAALLFWIPLGTAWRKGKLPPGIFRRAVVPAAMSLGGQIFWALAQYHLSASLIGFLVKTSILWALVGALVLFPDERRLLRDRRFHAGALLSVAGFVALSLAGGALEEPARAGAVIGSSAAGIVIILLCSVFFGLYGVAVRFFLRDVHPILAFGVVSQYTSAGTLALLFAVGTPSIVPHLPARAWGLIVASSLLGIGLSHVLFYTAIQRLGAAISNLGSLAGPFVTSLFAYVALGESMGPGRWGAGSCMIAGGALLLLAQQSLWNGRRT